MYRNADRTLSWTPRTRARAISVRASEHDGLRLLFGFGAIGILIIALVVAIVRAACAGQLG